MYEEMLSSTPCPETDNFTLPTYVGFIGTAVSVVFYGSNFVPIKKFETGDGMFFQWILCSAILIVGMVLQAIRRSTFYPIVMIGGAVWTTGNICVVPIVKTIGLGLGICVWGTFNLLSGWASGRFGWFGINPEVPGNQMFNYIGVSLAFVSAFVYALVKPEIDTHGLEMTFEVSGTEDEALLSNIGSVNRSSPNLSYGNDQTFWDKLGPKGKRVLGLCLALVSGVFYGLMFVPAIYVKDRQRCASQQSLDYVFAHFCGIFLTSTFYFIVYCAVSKNRPKIYPKAILPGFASGIMWGIATVCWFIANGLLSEPVSFPIIATVPGAIASLFWGVLVFKEIRGRRNILILLLAFSITVSGAVMAGLSKS